MARKKRDNFRKSNKYVYFIVEGCTEENYIKLLKIIYKKDISVKHCQGGSAKKVLKTAQKIINKNNNLYKGYVVWFDKDTYDKSKDINLSKSLEALDNVKIYISSPCVENWLLAHFQPVNKNEPRCDRCEQILRDRHIYNYKKNDCSMLQKFITEAKIKTATNNYPELQEIPTILENNRLPN